MAKVKLTARGADTRKPGKHADGDGLYLIVEKTGARAWWFIFSWQGRRPEMKLGGTDVLSLAEARDAATEARRKLAAGINPIDARREARKASAKPTFGEIADALIEIKSSGWRNEKHREQWGVSLKNGAAKLRPLQVDAIDTAAVLSVLKPVWLTTPESAMRLRQRIEAVLDAAKAQGHRTGENPAAWRGHLVHLLPKRPNVARGHHAAMPYSEVPAFVTKLRAIDTASARALEFAIFTAARSGEVYGARWSEIDTSAKIWTLPPERMKSGREHRVPLCARAVEIIEKQAASKVSDFVFPGQKANKSLSHIAMAKVLDRMKVENATPHGFRSSFRDWAGNETSFPREIAEAALAHTIGDAVERAYRRSDALERRRELMQAWANYCGGLPGANVVSLRTENAA